MEAGRFRERVNPAFGGADEDLTPTHVDDLRGYAEVVGTPARILSSRVSVGIPRAHSCLVDNHLNGWPEACQRAAVPGLLFHDLRRSAVRNMERAGIQDRVAMEISGHRSRSIFDRYNLIGRSDLQSAGERLEEYAQRRNQERATPLQRVK